MTVNTSKEARREGDGRENWEMIHWCAKGNSSSRNVLMKVVDDNR